MEDTAEFGLRQLLFVMAARGTTCLLIIFLRIESGYGLKAEGPKWQELLSSIYKEPCTYLLATESSPYQGKLLTQPPFLSGNWHLHQPSEIGTPFLRSQNAKELIEQRGNPLFSSVVASVSCLVTIVETHDKEDMLKLIEMVDDFSVAKKYLVLIAPTFGGAQLQNLTISFQTMILHRETG